MRLKKQRKPHKTFYAPKLVIFGIAIGVVLAITGSVGALNGWFASNNVPSDTMTRGLVGYWPMDEGSGGTAYDASDYGNHGILTNGPSWGGSTTTCKVGGCLTFDGTNDYVNAGNAASVNITSTITIEAWFYKPSLGAENTELVGKQNTYSLFWNNANSRIQGGLNIGGWDNRGGTKTLSLNTWYHVVMTYDGSYVDFYSNGVRDEHNYYPGTITTTANFLGIGYSTAYFTGLIDEVRIYNRALSAEEIRYHYNRGGPVAQWKFDEGEGRIAYDSAEASTTASIDGTLVLAGSATSSAWVTGKQGSAISFDGVDDYVDIGNTSQSTVKTVSFWLKADDITSRKVIDIDGTDQVEIDASSQVTATSFPGTITYYLNGIAGSRTLTANTWQHVVITDTTGVNASNMDIGRVSTGYFSGLIDDVRIYNYARTPDEIRLDYNAGFAAKFGGSPDCKTNPGSCMTQGLVGYWPMDEGTGGLAYDSSNYGNHGTLTSGPLWDKGKVSGTLSFDGNNDEISVPDSASLNFGSGDFAINFWLKFNSVANALLLSQRYNPSTSYGWQSYFTSPSSLFFQYTTDGSTEKGTSVSWTPSANTWYQIAFVRNGANLMFFVNGAQVGSNFNIASDSIFNSTANLDIGGGTGGYFLNGLMDEVRIYNRALSPEEVRYHYNRGGPVAQWKFDEGEGRTAYDSTDNNNDGTLVLAGSATSSAWVQGKYGSALSFDGVDDYVDIGNTSQSTVKTVSFWLKADDITSRKIIDIDGTDQVEIDASSQVTATSFPGTITYYLNGIAGSRTLTANTWQHVVITDITGVNASNMDIGRVSTGYFSGLIDDVRIYNYARTPDEIRLDYNSGYAVHIGSTYGNCKDDPGSCMTQGLVGYWPMDEGSGGLAYDSSNYGNNGTLTSGPLWDKGKVGGGLQFDGNNDVVSVSDNASLKFGTGDFTAEIWAKTTQSAQFPIIFRKEDEIAARSGWTFYTSNGTLVFAVLSGGTEASKSSANTINDGLWHHLVGVKTATAIELFIDGVSNGKTAHSLGSTDKAIPVQIGNGDIGGRAFNGTIDEARVYNRALSAEEVRYHYNRGGPVAQWKFDEGEGRTAYDSTDNNNDGTLVLVGSATTSAWVSGKSGSALNFDGVDDYVDAGNVSANARTISFWLKRADTSDKDVVDLGTPEIKISSNAITSTGLTSPTYYVDGVAGATAISDTSWHFISITDTADISASNVDIAKAATNYFLGLIDDVRIYNYARSSLQIPQDYNSGLSAHFR